MSRRRRAEKRVVHVDPKYGDLRISKFINQMMVMGKKAVAEKIMYDALEAASDKLNQDPVELFKEALENVSPNLEVRSRRVGGATYQVPTEVRPERKQALAMRWLISAARNRGENTMVDKLSAEFVDAYSKRGAAIKKREDTHKMAEANKAFAHFRW